MAYNKSKYVEAAQKLLNQGKVAQAIAEYQQILKYEPRDQVTLMTIGELYIRQGETFQAIDYFERLAQIFVGDGFLTKAIAVYKRIAKLAPEEIRPLEKLADLYVQQGVMSEARPLFLQLAEIHLKNNRQPEAVGLLKKLLQAEPDNLRIQIRLADLYQAMGQTRDAIEAYVSASQRALSRGDQAESERLADKALKLEPNNLAAVIVKARSHSSQGNHAKAEQLLEQVADLEKGGEQTELLLDLYLKNSDWDQATALAHRVFEADQKNFGPMQKVVESLLQSGNPEKAVEILEKSRLPMIDAGEHEVVGKLLNELASSMPGSIQALEWLVELYGRTSDSFRLPDALAHLGDALVAAHQWERAKKTFEQLVERDPESDSGKRRLNGVLKKMGLLAPGEAAEELPEEDLRAEILKPPAAKLPVEDEESAPEPPAKPVVTSTEAGLDEETQKFIAQSLTDVDLFASYGLTQKAIGLLEAILRRAPRHTPTLEKLLDFVLGAGDDRRTAELAAQLEQIHHEGGDPRSSERFGELRRRFQRAAGLTDEELAISTSAPKAGVREAHTSDTHDITIPEVSAEPTPKPAAPVEEVKPTPVEASVAKPAPEVKKPKVKQAEPKEEKEEVHEVDLSDEWATLLEESRGGEATVETSAAPRAKPSGTPAPPPEPGAIEEFQIGEEPSFVLPEEAPAAAAKANPFAEISAELPATDEAKKTPAPEVPKKPAKAPEPEFELEQDFELVLDPEPLVPAYDQKPPETPIAPPQREPVAQNASPAPPAGSGFASDQFLADLANEIDGLELDKLSPAFSGSMPGTPSHAPATRDSAPTPPMSTGPLKEVFDEFRAELGEMGAEEEDLETHYNLGIAFREMGLLEEAISEY